MASSWVFLLLLLCLFTEQLEYQIMLPPRLKTCPQLLTAFRIECKLPRHPRPCLALTSTCTSSTLVCCCSSTLPLFYSEVGQVLTGIFWCGYLLWCHLGELYYYLLRELPLSTESLEYSKHSHFLKSYQRALFSLFLNFQCLS